MPKFSPGQGELFGVHAGKPHFNKCRHPDCARPARSMRSMYCNAHYQRGRTKGATKGRNKTGVSSNGYRYTYQKGHPLAQSNGLMWEHRKVLWDKLGPGDHRCHWCDALLDWFGEIASKLVVDHLDGDKLNNDSNNLAPSCHSCNYGRGVFLSWINSRNRNLRTLRQLRDWLDETIGNAQFLANLENEK